jgi:membrane protein
VLDSIDDGGPAIAAIRIVQLPAFGVVFAGGITLLYRYGPDRSPRTPWRNPGAALAGLVWLVFATAFSLYSTNVGRMPASYGILGTVAALMIFLQLSALAVIVGAEYNAVAEGPHGRADPGPTTATEIRSQTPEPVSFGKAMAALAALLLLGRRAGS